MMWYSQIKIYNNKIKKMNCVPTCNSVVFEKIFEKKKRFPFKHVYMNV